MKLNLGSGRFPLDGFVNIDDNPDWRPDRVIDLCCGLRFAADSTIEAVTISHVLMYFGDAARAFLLSEIHRVLVPGGWVRLTEDDTMHPDSSRQGIQPGAATATAPGRQAQDLADVGFSFVAYVLPDVTLSDDPTLIQRWHGEPPDVFHVEAQKSPTRW